MAAKGWLRLHRKALNSRVFANDWLWRLWSWCLMNASWTPQWINASCEIKPGQFVTSRDLAARELRVTPSKLYRGLQGLKDLGQITLEANSQFTIVTVCNWRTYQSDSDEERTASEQRVNSERTAA